MKTALLTCLLLLTALVGRGQPTEWFPVGATWQMLCGTNPGLGTPCTMYCEKDTMIESKICKKLILQSESLYFYQNGDTVFYLDESTNTFCIYYNMSLEKGDMTRLSLYPKPICTEADNWHEEIIDSIGTVNYSNHTLRFQSFGTLTTDPNRHDLILEKLGRVSFVNLSDNLYNYQNNFRLIPYHPLAIGNYSLLCYSDPTTTINFTAGADSCSGRFVHRLDRIPKDNIKVYTQDQDVIVKSSTPLQKVEVYNLTGGLLYTQQLNNNKTAVLHGVAINQTLLLVYITTKDNYTYTQKIIIQ